MPARDAGILFATMAAVVLLAAGAFLTDHHLYFLTRWGYSRDVGILTGVFVIGSVLLWRQKSAGLWYFALPGILILLTTAFMIYDGRPTGANIPMVILLLALCLHRWKNREYLGN